MKFWDNNLGRPRFVGGFFLEAAVNKYLIEWLEALESGKYKQGKELLKDDSGKFCCLGVACDLASDIGEWDKDPSGNPAFRVRGDKNTLKSLPPAVVIERMGLPKKTVMDIIAEGSPCVEVMAFEKEGDKILKHVSYLNDRSGLSFNEIADAIRRTYDKLGG